MPEAPPRQPRQKYSFCPPIFMHDKGDFCGIVPIPESLGIIQLSSAFLKLSLPEQKRCAGMEGVTLKLFPQCS